MLAALFREGVNDIEVDGVLIEEVPILEVEINLFNSTKVYPWLVSVANMSSQTSSVF